MVFKNLSFITLDTRFREYARFSLFLFLSLACFIPWITTPMALITGLIFGFTLGCPAPAKISIYTKFLLQASVIGLGFGIPVIQVLKTGQEGLFASLTTIGLTIFLGLVFSHFLKMKNNTAMLISCGTAICGGSAIAAVAPVLKADSEDISVSMAAVFSLNAVALLIFPWLGHAFNLTPAQFGLWSALAIHDTSSVVGAASTFGAEALSIATTVKLSRAIFIFPLVLLVASFKGASSKLSIPWFVLFFILAASTRSLFPKAEHIFDFISLMAKQSLCLVLFWIGASLSRNSLKRIGARPFVYAVLLWIFLGLVSLLFITLKV